MYGTLLNLNPCFYDEFIHKWYRSFRHNNKLFFLLSVYVCHLCATTLYDRYGISSSHITTGMFKLSLPQFHLFSHVTDRIRLTLYQYYQQIFTKSKQMTTSHIKQSLLTQPSIRDQLSLIKKDT